MERGGGEVERERWGEVGRSEEGRDKSGGGSVVMIVDDC